MRLAQELVGAEGAGDGSVLWQAFKPLALTSQVDYQRSWCEDCLCREYSITGEDSLLFYLIELGCFAYVK